MDLIIEINWFDFLFSYVNVVLLSFSEITNSAMACKRGNLSLASISAIGTCMCGPNSMVFEPFSFKTGDSGFYESTSHESRSKILKVSHKQARLELTASKL